MIFAAPTTRPRRAPAVLAGTVGALLALSACAAGDVQSGGESSSASGGGSDSKTIIVGGPDFTEAAIMENMYVQLLDDAGFTTELVTVGNRELYFGQLEQGKIQVVPDYLGTLTEYMNVVDNGEGVAPVASSDVEATLKVAREMAATHDIELLEPAKAQDKNAFAVTKDFAQQNNLKTLSDLGALGQPVILAGTEECATRPFCVPSLEDVYGIDITSVTPTGFATPATKKEVQSGKAQLALAASTDATLDQFDLVELEDDKNVQQAENLIPAVNKDVAGDQKLVEALNSLADVLTTEDLAQLNAQVDTERQKPEDVAKEYLTDKKLIGG